MSTLASPTTRAATLLAVLAAAAPARAQACTDEVRLVYLDAGTSAPTLRTPKGAPVLGGDFAFRVHDAAPGLLGVLLYSGFENPILEPTLGAVVWPEFPWFTWYFGTTATGDSPLVLNTPEVTDDLCGAMATFQGFLFDPGVPSGITVTNAVRLRVGLASPPFFYSPEVAPAVFTSRIAFGDMDGDGLRDMVTLEVGTNHQGVVVRPGLRAGGFGNALATPIAGLHPTSLELAHLDGDAHLDVVVANNGITFPDTVDDVTVLLGDGAGGFSSETRYTASAGAHSTAVGDVDGDGDADIVVGNDETAFVSLLLGDGTGAFAPPVNLFAGSGSGGSGPIDVVLADANGDDELDIVAAVTFGRRVSVLLGNGDGTFAAPIQTTFGQRPVQVGVLDLDGDEIPDIVVDQVDTFSGFHLLAARHGNGDGTFGPETSLGAGGAFALADVDGDSLEDVVLLRAGLVAVLRVTADGELPIARHFVAAADGTLGIADVDLDGAADVVLADPDGLVYVSGRGDGTLAAPPAITTTATETLVIADLDEDGFGDLVNSRVWMGQSDGSFVDGGALTLLPGSYFGLATADFDGDGHADLLAWNTPQLLLGAGDGSFAAPLAIAAGADLQRARVTDLNGDLVPDIVATTDGDLRTLLGVGDGTFAAPAVSPPAPGLVFDVGRVNGDAHVDAVIGGAQGFVTLLPGNGDGTFGTAAPLGVFGDPEDREIRQIALADLDADGASDLLVAVGFQPATAQVWSLLGNGDGTFQAPVAVPNVGTDYIVSLRQQSDVFLLGDWDGDAFPDLVTAADAVRLLRGNGDGTFAAPIDHLPGVAVPRGGMGDVDGDGIPDVMALVPPLSTPALSPKLATLLDLLGE